MNLFSDDTPLPPFFPKMSLQEIWIAGWVSRRVPLSKTEVFALWLLMHLKQMNNKTEQASRNIHTLLTFIGA